MNSYAKFGGAARRHFSAICEKPMGGGAHMCPPGRARVNEVLLYTITEERNVRYYTTAKCKEW